MGFAGQGGMGWGEGDDGNMGNTTYWFPERQYRSSQGRWLVPDPAGVGAVDPSNPQTWNRYAYVMNNPLAMVDPLGLCGQGPGGEYVCRPPCNDTYQICRYSANGQSLSGNQQALAETITSG